MKENKKFTFTVQQIAVLGVLMALELAISRVSVLLGPSNRLTFGFIIHAVIGIMYGPWVAGLAAAGSDLLKSFLFGVQGQFFIGFTLTAFVGVRKSTRLNSSHVAISYAVFCLKKNIRTCLCC